MPNVVFLAGRTFKPVLLRTRTSLLPHGPGTAALSSLPSPSPPFRRLLASIDNIDDKLLFVEQETYSGTPLESVRSGQQSFPFP